MPEISVIVPVYQAEKFVEKCVESVKNQTFSDWELLLVDDGCTDGSPALCDRFAAEDDRVRVFHRKKNGGVSAARNLALEEAQGSPFWTRMTDMSRSFCRPCTACAGRRGRTPPPAPI